jgi:hypothetical protein
MCRVHQTLEGKWEMPPQFYARLARGGLREAFNCEVERLKAEGVEHPQRWAEAAAMFPPLDKVVEKVEVVEAEFEGEIGDYLSAQEDGDSVKSLSGMMPRYMAWLDRNLGMPLRKEDPAPSAMCLWLHGKGEKPEWTGKIIDIISKHIQSASMQEEALRFSDDGRATLELLDRCEEALGE